MIRINECIPDTSEYDLEKERCDLRDFCERSGIVIPNSFFQAIRRGDVIDLYTLPPDLRQLYCNGEFRRLCSYTEEQMRNFPFTKLFWRPDNVQLALLQRATEIALQANDTTPWGIERHELVESKHPRKRTFEIDLGSGAPCFDRETGRRIGFVSSLGVRLIFEWPESKLVG